jgi:AcrR family transcriptional regulator
VALRADARRNRARILDAAAQVFAEKGATASTEEVAARAGVAIGTVFRHFPTKDDLLRAILKDLLQRLTDEVAALHADGDPATALFTFFADLVARAAANRSVVEALGVDVDAAVAPLRQGVAGLLTRAQQVGAVRAEVRVAEVMALLGGTCQGALRWDPELRQRTLAIVFAGLATSPGSAARAVAPSG